MSRLDNIYAWIISNLESKDIPVTAENLYKGLRGYRDACLKEGVSWSEDAILDVVAINEELRRLTEIMDEKRF